MHERAAKRILRLCEENRGFYIKAGQFIASMQQVPKEFVSTLSVLQDKVNFFCPFYTRLEADRKLMLSEEFGVYEGSNYSCLQCLCFTRLIDHIYNESLSAL